MATSFHSPSEAILNDSPDDSQLPLITSITTLAFAELLAIFILFRILRPRGAAGSGGRGNILKSTFSRLRFTAVCSYLFAIPAKILSLVFQAGIFVKSGITISVAFATLFFQILLWLALVSYILSLLNRFQRLELLLHQSIQQYIFNFICCLVIGAGASIVLWQRILLFETAASHYAFGIFEISVASLYALLEFLINIRLVVNSVKRRHVTENMLKEEGEEEGEEDGVGGSSFNNILATSPSSDNLLPNTITSSATNSALGAGSSSLISTSNIITTAFSTTEINILGLRNNGKEDGNLHAVQQYSSLLRHFILKYFLLLLVFDGAAIGLSSLGYNFALDIAISSIPFHLFFSFKLLQTLLYGLKSMKQIRNYNIGDKGAGGGGQTINNLAPLPASGSQVRQPTRNFGRMDLANINVPSNYYPPPPRSTITTTSGVTGETGLSHDASYNQSISSSFL